MDSVALSKEEQNYFETGGEAIPSPVSEVAPEENTNSPAAEQVAEENQAETAQDQARDEKTGRFVPHQALHQERLARKEAQAELQKVLERQAILEDRWNTLLKIQEQPKQEAPTGPPDPEQDIFAAIKWQQETLLKQQQEREAELKKRQEYEQQTQAEREITGYWQQSVQEYASREPEFSKVAEWMQNERHRYFKGMAHIDPRLKDEGFRNEMINNEIKSITNHARQNGQNPAEMIHTLAREWGYNGQAQAQNTQVPDTLAKLEQAQAASRTLAATGGKTGADPLTADAILGMSNDEFSKWIEEPGNQSRFNKMMGGR